MVFSAVASVRSQTTFDPAMLWREFTDIGFLQGLLNDFALLTGVTLVIMDTEGKPVTEQTEPYNRLCRELVKSTPLGRQGCNECDMRWGAAAAQEQTYKVYTCKHGLIDFVSPILFEGYALGCVFGGQVRLAPAPGEKPRLTETVTIEALDEAVEKGELVALPRQWYIHHAASLGLGSTEYLFALDKITVLPREKIEASARILHNIANSVSSLITSCVNERRSMAGFEQAAAGLVNPERAPDEVHETAERICRQALAVLRANFVQLHYKRPDAAEFAVPPVTVGESPARVGLSECWAGEVVERVRRTGDAVFHLSAGVVGDAGGQPAAAGQTVSWAAVPIKTRGLVLGVLLAAYRPARELENDAELRPGLSFVVNRAGILIENALLRYQLKTRSEIQDEVSAARAKRVAKRILDELRESFEYRSASLQLVRGDTRTLLAGSGFDDQVPERGLLRPVSRDQLISRIVNSRQPLILSHPSDDPDWKQESGTWFVKSWVGLPVVYDSRVIALLTLDHDQPGFYTEALRQNLLQFADHVAPRIWHARLWDSAERLIRDMDIINQVAQVVSTKLDTQALLHTIAAQIAERLNCTHCTIFFAERENGQVVLAPKVTHGGDDALMVRRFKLGEGIAGWAFAEAKPVLVSDAESEPRFAPAAQARGPRSMVAAPIRVGDQTIGVITADQDALNWFSESDKRLMDVLARQVGIAIQRSMGLKLLQDIGNRIIGLGNVDEIMQVVVSGAIRLTNTTTGVIYRVSEDGRTLLGSFHPPGYRHPPPRLGREDSLTRAVIRTGEMVQIPDIRNHPLVNPVLHADFRSMIVVPLKIGAKVIGVLYLNDADEHSFTETETSLLETLATQAAIGIQKATLLSDQQRLHRVLEDVLQNLVVEEHDQERALESIGRGIRGILGEEVSPTINLYNAETETFEACHAYGPLANELKVPPRCSGGTGRHVLSTGQPLLLPDVGTPPPGCPTIRAASIELGIRSFAAIPLKRRDEIVGVLFINSQKPLEFDDELQRVLAIFASQAAVAIEIARFHESADIYGAMVKAADLGYLASGIAHEFNNNLHNMGNTLWRLERAHTDEGRYELQQEFRDEIKRAVRTIDTFYGFRDRVDSIENVDVEVLVNTLIALSRSRAEKNRVKLDCRRIDVKQVRTNGSLLQSVLVNLLCNAMDAVESTDGPRVVEIEVSARGASAFELQVSDSGPGILPGDISKLFLPFYTTKGSRSLGVGLYLVQRIVNRMQGSIRVEAKGALGGATFRVTLPIQP